MFDNDDGLTTQSHNDFDLTNMDMQRTSKTSQLPYESILHPDNSKILNKNTVVTPDRISTPSYINTDAPLTERYNKNQQMFDEESKF